MGAGENDASCATCHEAHEPTKATAECSSCHIDPYQRTTFECTVCHGDDGKGNGPILDYLKNAPADLTQIAARNGGRFPFQDVFDTIADVDSNRAHGTSEMPVWGNRFNMEVIAVEGEFGSSTSRMPSARSRILELVFYLATIQQ